MSEPRERPIRHRCDADAVRAARSSGLTTGEVATRFGISINLVRRIVREGVPAGERRTLRPRADYKEIVRRYQAGERCTAITRAMDIAPATVSRALTMAGIKSRGPTYRIDVDEQKIADAYAASGSLTAVARSFGVSRNVVERRVTRAGVPLRKREHKLRTRDVVELYRQRWSCQRIAKRCGTSRETIVRRLKAAGVRIRGVKDATAPIGTVRWLENQGYHRIKTAEGWKNAHRWRWERAYGPVPAGYEVIRIDRSLPPEKIDQLPNLALISSGARAGARWTAHAVDLEDDPGARRETLTCILLMAALKSGDTGIRFGSAQRPT